MAESDRLTVVVVAAQAHFSAHHSKSPTGAQVLADKSLKWSIEEVITWYKMQQMQKMPLWKLDGLSFDAIREEVIKQSKEAGNLPPLEKLLTH